MYDALCVQVQHSPRDIQSRGHNSCHIPLPVSEGEAAPLQEVLQVSEVRHLQHQPQLQGGGSGQIEQNKSERKAIQQVGSGCECVST